MTSRYSRLPSISVVIPVLNEEKTIRSALESVRKQDPFEILVVDGDSQDRTVEEARQLADRILQEPGGLARQLNAGAHEACGDALLFHYADVRLPEGGLEAISESLAREDVVGGAFRFGLESRRFPYSAIAFGANLRNRLGFGPFGDQGIFVRKSVFMDLGGYRPEMFLEDLDLVKRLRKKGEFELLPLAVRASVRRWEREGVLKTAIFHWGMSAAYLLGRRRSGPWLRSVKDRLRTRR